MRSHWARRTVKATLAALERNTPPVGASLLIYHRVGAGTVDELDVTTEQFRSQLDLLGEREVLSLDAALDRLDTGGQSPSVVITFDDGFLDVYENAWPLLRDRQLPFTLYLASSYVGGKMSWPGSTAKGVAGQGLTWTQLDEMLSSGLCTIGNHTHTHVRPEFLTVEELDVCSAMIERHLGVVPQHFTYPWGVPVHGLESALEARFRSSSTGMIGRNLAQTNRQRLFRIPVRQSDPPAFFAAKLIGDLEGERRYEAMVSSVKSLLGARGHRQEGRARDGDDREEATS